MQERIANWLYAAALTLAACGGVEAGDSLVKSRQALTCQADTDCGDGYACTHFAQRSYCEPTAAAASTTASFVGMPDTTRTCQSDADCAAGEECEDEHGSAYYCTPHHEEGKEHYGPDAGAPPEDCRHDGDDCYYGKGGCADAGRATECEDEHHDEPAYEDEHHDGDDGDDYDRSGSNRGPH